MTLQLGEEFDRAVGRDLSPISRAQDQRALQAAGWSPRAEDPGLWEADAPQKEIAITEAPPATPFMSRKSRVQNRSLAEVPTIRHPYSIGAQPWFYPVHFTLEKISNPRYLEISTNILASAHETVFLKRKVNILCCNGRTSLPYRCVG